MRIRDHFIAVTFLFMNLPNNFPALFYGPLFLLPFLCSQTPTHCGYPIPTACAQSLEGLIQSACVEFCPVFRRFTRSPGSKKGNPAVLKGSSSKDERVTLGNAACHRFKRRVAPCGTRSKCTRFHGNTCLRVRTAEQNCVPGTHTKLISLSTY